MSSQGRVIAVEERGSNSAGSLTSAAERTAPTFSDVGLGDRSAAPEGVSHNQEVTLAALGKIIGSAKFEFGAGVSESQKIENSENLDVNRNFIPLKFWKADAWRDAVSAWGDAGRRTHLLMRAACSPFTKGEADLVGRDEQTLNMMDRETYLDARALLKARAEGNSEIVSEKGAAILARLETYLEANQTLSKHEKENLRRATVLFTNNDTSPQAEAQRQEFYESTDDSQHETTRQHVKARIYGTAIRLVTSSVSKVLSVASAPITAGWGVALGSSVETIANLKTSEEVERAALRHQVKGWGPGSARGGVEDALNREIATFLSSDHRNVLNPLPTHDQQLNKTSTDGEPAIFGHFAQLAELAKGNPKSEEARVNMLRAGAVILNNAEQLRKLRKDGGGTLSAATYGSYQEIQRIAQTTRALMGEAIGGSLDGTMSTQEFLGVVGRELERVSPRDPQNRVAIEADFVTQVREREAKALESYVNDAGRDILKATWSIGNVSKVAFFAGLGNTAAVVARGCQAMQEAVKGQRIIGVTGDQMRLQLDISGQAARNFQRATGFGKEIGRFFGDKFGELAAHQWAAKLGTEAANNQFQTTQFTFNAAGRMNGIRDLGQEELTRNAAEAVGRHFNISEKGGSFLTGQGVNLTGYEDRVKELLSQGFERARMFDFDAHQQVFQGVGARVANIAMSIASGASLAQVWLGRKGVTIDHDNRFECQRPITPQFSMPIEQAQTVGGADVEPVRVSTNNIIDGQGQPRLLRPGSLASSAIVRTNGSNQGPAVDIVEVLVEVGGVSNQLNQVAPNGRSLPPASNIDEESDEYVNLRKKLALLFDELGLSGFKNRVEALEITADDLHNLAAQLLDLYRQSPSTVEPRVEALVALAEGRSANSQLPRNTRNNSI